MPKNPTKWPLFKKWKRKFQQEHPEVLQLPSEARKAAYTLALRKEGIPVRSALPA